MTPLKEVGECLICIEDEDYFFRPSFINMARIGDPQEIVQAYYDLHNDEMQRLIIGVTATTGTLPGWFIKYLNSSSIAKRSLIAAMDVMQACCDRDITKLIGQ